MRGIRQCTQMQNILYRQFMDAPYSTYMGGETFFNWHPTKQMAVLDKAEHCLTNLFFFGILYNPHIDRGEHENSDKNRCHIANEDPRISPDVAACPPARVPARPSARRPSTAAKRRRPPGRPLATPKDDFWGRYSKIVFGMLRLFWER